MAETVTITERQTPQFRALIKAGNVYFDASQHLATQAELTAEGIDAPPASCTIYKSNSKLSNMRMAADAATPVEGYEDIEIDPATAFLSPATAETLSPPYNFQFTPAARTSCAFRESGWYFADFTIYPKTGAFISFRVPIKVE